MVIGDVTQSISENLKAIGYGGGLYVITYPAYYVDGAPITLAVKLEHDTEVVLERGEEIENMGLLSTSDEYTILDLGSVYERYCGVEGIDDIIKHACFRHFIKYENSIISLDADVDTTLNKINRYIKCIFEIESKVLDKTDSHKNIDNSHTTGASEKLMAYLNKKGN